MGRLKDLINDKIERDFYGLDYATEFMDDLEKKYPKLYEKFINLLWEYFKEEVNNDLQNEAELLKDLSKENEYFKRIKWN